MKKRIAAYALGILILYSSYRMQSEKANYND